MQHATLNRFHAGLLALLLLCVTLPAFAQAAPAPKAAPQAASQGDAAPEVEAPSLDDLNEQLDQIRQKVTVSANDDLLSSLRQAALQVQKQADELIAKQAVDIEHLNDQLNILGPVQPDEAPALTSQRKALTAQKNALVSTGPGHPDLQPASQPVRFPDQHSYGKPVEFGVLVDPDSPDR